MEDEITTMKMEIGSGQVEKGQRNIFARKKWLLLGITIFIGSIGLTIVLCLVDLRPTSNHSEPVPENILETKTLKWIFPEGDFNLCCSTIEATQYYLNTCNEIFNPENIQCIDVDEGSIILTLESTLIDFEKGVLNALSEINHIGGQPTKDHRKYEPGENIIPEPKVPDLESIKPGKNIEQKPKVPDLDPNEASEDIETESKVPDLEQNEAGEDSKIYPELSDSSPNDCQPDQDIKTKPLIPDSNSNDFELGENIELHLQVSDLETKAGEKIEQNTKVPNSEPNEVSKDIETKSEVPELSPFDLNQCEPNEQHPITEKACDCGVTGACFKGQYCYLIQGSMRCHDRSQKEEKKKEGEIRAEKNLRIHGHGFMQGKILEVFSKSNNAWMNACDYKLKKDGRAIIQYKVKGISCIFKKEVNLRNINEVRLRVNHEPAIPNMFQANRRKTKLKEILKFILENKIEEESEENENDL